MWGIIITTLSVMWHYSQVVLCVVCLFGSRPPHEGSLESRTRPVSVVSAWMSFSPSGSFFSVGDSRGLLSLQRRRRDIFFGFSGSLDMMLICLQHTQERRTGWWDIRITICIHNHGNQIFISAVKRLIPSKIKVVYKCAVYIYYVYINTNTCMFSEKYVMFID